MSAAGLHALIPKPPKRQTYAQRRAKWVREFKAVCREVWDTRPHQCEECGNDIYEARVDNFHHVIFRSQGGDNSPENIRLLCEGCHDLAHGIRRK